MASEYTICVNGARYGCKFTVRAVSAEIAGLYDERDGTINRPCDVDIVQLMPKRLRKAFDRSSKRFWHDARARIDASGRLVGGNCPYLELTDYRGRYLATLYAIPN